MHASKYFYGTWNDKLITVNDTFPMEVWNGQRFAHVRYVLFNKNGLPITYQGVWIAVDGGYQKVACFIDPMHNRYGFPEVVFSEWLECFACVSTRLFGSTLGTIVGSALVPAGSPVIRKESHASGRHSVSLKVCIFASYSTLIVASLSKDRDR